MIPSLLDQRWRLYAYVTQETEGIIEPTYQFVREVWGRVEDVGPRQMDKKGALQDEADAQLVVHEEVVVPARGLCRSEDGTEEYRIIGQVRRRGLGLKAVRLARASEDDFVKVES